MGNRQTRRVFEYGHKIDQYQVVKLLGQGGYGDVYYVLDTQTRMPYAMKCERMDAKKQGILREMEFIRRFPKNSCFAEVFAESDNGKYRYLVMDLLGPSLSSIRRHLPDSHFTIPTLVFVSKEMMNCIHVFHDIGFVHRDIKPSQFLIRPGAKHNLALVDFGLSKAYINFETHELLQPLSQAGFKGTLKYSSPNACHSMDLSRRDDIYSWFYSVVELYSGKLPWAEIKDPKVILKEKRHFRRSEVFRSLPKRLAEILFYVDSLGFNDKPDYDYINSEMDGLARDFGVGEAEHYDWEGLTDEVAKKISVYPLKRSEEKLEPFPAEDVANAERLEDEKRKKKIEDSNKQKRARSAQGLSTTCILL